MDRAKDWIEKSEDVDVENIEATIQRFEIEMKKSNSGTFKNGCRFLDLGMTIDYLKEQLHELGALPCDQTRNNKSIQKDPVPDEHDYKFDPSSLVDMSKVETVTLSDQERETALSKIKQLPGIISGTDLTEKRNSA
ncbi:hypothetical protein [Microbulbifer epialgicus]|uniref:Uncharacterized protein n=1 Tax=Microbulbifer epialgicus TaxID=393907 RepID=A0ABV4NT84_9GAMM